MLVEVDHNYLVKEKAYVDNFGYFDGELGFLDKDLFDHLSMELGNLEGHFGRVDLGLNILEGVLCSLTAHWHN